MIKILYIEDDPSSVKLVERILRMGRYEMISASDAREGLSLAHLESPDLILLDFLLPGMNGLQTTFLLKTVYRTRHIPIIGVTAASDDHDMRRFIDQGCDAVVYKPIHAADLLSTIDVVMARHKTTATV